MQRCMLLLLVMLVAGCGKKDDSGPSDLPEPKTELIKKDKTEELKTSLPDS